MFPLVLVIGGGIFYGPAIVDLFPVVRALLEKPKETKYAGSVDLNLQELHKAILLTHENEGQFPEADKWMDQVKPSIRTNEMKEEEAIKKFLDPTQENGHFALNEAVSGKYKGDLNAKTPLLFQVASGAWNAHAPVASAIKGSRAIAIDGTLLNL